MAVLKEVTGAGGEIKATGGYVSAVVLTPAAVAATAELRDGGATGTVLLTLKATIGGLSVPVSFPRPVGLATDIYVTLDGEGALCSVAYE
ncbi:MAG TPA: hypothetical protein VMZ50_07785 [Phycisphaerae bacterium]|nr:hypothetical protein [Phycisphaerae bacterium]